RGSVPTPQIENLAIGGNTPCLSVESPSGETVFFDAGTGIRKPGAQLVEQNADEPLALNIFLTHFHWDHIQGIPFFAPLYGRRNTIRFLTALNECPLRDVLEGQMTQPYFPVMLSQVEAERDFEQLNFGCGIDVGCLTVRPFPLNHPQGACGYR